MADKAKQLGLIIAVIAGITLPTLAIAWVGGGRLATVEVVAENAKEKSDENTKEIALIKEDIHKVELLMTRVDSKLDDIPDIKRDVDKITDHLLQYDFNSRED